MKIIQIDDCPACGGNSSKTFFSPDESTWKRFFELSKKKYQGYMDKWDKYLDLKIKKCKDCGHFWQHTHPDFSSLLGMYKAGISLNERDPAREPNTNMVRKMDSLYRLVYRKGCSAPTLLDYGSGRGRWTLAAIRVGFHVWAYEPSTYRSKEGTGNYLTVDNLEKLTGIQFDVINLEQVLEHTHMPLNILNDLFKFLKPDSLLRITVPNVKGLKVENLKKDFPFNGKRMHILSPYEHLHGFTPTSLKILLKRAGLVQARMLKAWRTHTIYQIRTLIGHLLPGFSTTMAIIRPSKILRQKLERHDI